MSIAILITCHNRKEKTLSCLRSVYGQSTGERVYLEIFVVDAGSTDGTPEAIKEAYPNIRLLCYDDTVYWCMGMRIAMSEAMKEGYSFYMWLNDDTFLYTDAILRLLNTYEMLRRERGLNPIIIGSVKDPNTNKLSYGGLRKKYRWHPLIFEKISPQDIAIKCDTMNGNCVLIPDGVAQMVGLDPLSYTHGCGDYDYGLTASKMGFSCWVAPGYFGVCEINQGKLKERKLSFTEKLEIIKSPTGLPPPKDWKRFVRRHGGWLWPFYWIRTSVREAAPWLWVLLKGWS